MVGKDEMKRKKNGTKYVPSAQFPKAFVFGQ